MNNWNLQTSDFTVCSNAGCTSTQTCTVLCLIFCDVQTLYTIFAMIHEYINIYIMIYIKYSQQILYGLVLLVRKNETCSFAHMK